MYMYIYIYSEGQEAQSGIKRKEDEENEGGERAETKNVVSRKRDVVSSFRFLGNRRPKKIDARA